MERRSQERDQRSANRAGPDDKLARLHRSGGASGRTHGSGCILVALVVLVPIMLYFGLFALLLIDEAVLDSRYLGRSKLPGGVGDLLETIYYPLIVVVKQALHGGTR